MKKILLAAVLGLVPILASSQTTIRGSTIVDHSVPLAKTSTLTAGVTLCAPAAGDGNVAACTASQARAAAGAAASGANVDITSLTGLSAGGLPLSSLPTQATATFLGNVSGNTAAPGPVTATQATATLNPCTSSLKGLVPTPPNDGTQYLAGDCTFKTALTPASVAASGNVTGANLTGSNSGDLTLSASSTSPNSAGATLTGQSLVLQLANGSFAGLLSAAGYSNLANQSGTNSGDDSVGTFGSTPTANGATLTSHVLALQPADATHPGAITTGAQSFAGAKTFTGVVVAPSVVADITNAFATALGGSASISNAARFSQIFNVIDYGAVPDSIGYADGTITSGSHNFASASATFTSADVGKVLVQDFGNGISPLQTTIATFVDAHHVTLTAAPSISAPFSFVSGVTIVPYSTGAGGYVPGVALTVTGGTGTAAVITPRSTQIVKVTQTANGSGGSNGTCVLTGTTGTTLGDATSGVGRFRVNATISAGAISAIGSIVSPGGYTTNPTSLTAEPVTGCGLSGATVAITTWPLTSTVTTPGKYTVSPTSPVSVTSTSGNGATFNTAMVPIQFYYGTDNTAAFNAAETAANNATASQKQVAVRIPGGNYLLGTGTIATTSKPISWIGDGHEKSIVQIAPGYVGPDVFSWSETWLGVGVNTFNNQTRIAGNFPAGAGAEGISIIGDRGSVSNQYAITGYDSNDEMYINDINVAYLRGSCMRFGVTKNTAVSQLRESVINNVRCNNSGDAGIAVIDFESVGSFADTDELMLNNINIYAPYGDGMWIGAARNIYANNVRIEGLEFNPANIQGHLLHIGGSTAAYAPNLITFTNSELADPYEKFSALYIDHNDSSSTYQPYGIIFKGVYGGGAGFGKGLNIRDGRLIQTAWTAAIQTFDTNVTVASGATLDLDLNGAEATTTFNLAAPGAVSSLLRVAGAANDISSLLKAFDTSSLGLGVDALPTSGANASNTAVGGFSCALISTGTLNTCIGTGAGSGSGSLTGSRNTLVGAGAGASVTTGADSNTAVGSGAMSACTTCIQNIILGSLSGNTLTTGSADILIGENIQPPLATSNSYMSIGNVIKGNLFALHHSWGGGAPTPACNAGTGTLDAAATDMSGTLTAGAAATSCTVTFANAMAGDHCRVTFQSLGAVTTPGYSYTGTVLTITAASGLGGTKVDYDCDGP